MGFLTLAGAISGAGKAGQQAFSDMSRFAAADMMETRREEMDLQKQERLLEAQRGMHRETIAATSKEKSLDRTAAEDNLATQLRSQEKIAVGHDTTTEAVHRGDREAAERRHKADLASHQEIADLNARTSKAIAAGHDVNAKDIAKINKAATAELKELDLRMRKYEIEQTSVNASKMSSSRGLTEAGNDITRLTALLANPMLDPEMAKELRSRLKFLEQERDAFARQLLTPEEKERVKKAATETKTLPPFQFPKNIPPPRSGGGYPGSFRAPGVKVLPIPGEQEQEMMRRALQP